MSDPWDDLAALFAYLWARLDAGVADAADPFRIVALATTGAEGAEARMVGLRAADKAAATVEVHSDMRTAKVAALRRDPRGALLFWDAETQVQLRLSVRFNLGVDPKDRWDRVPAAARGNYGTDPAPGSPIADPMAYERTPSVDRFAVLSGRVTAMDAVSLRHNPHRRAMFGGDDMSGRWVAP
ncbi:hypothetical protein JANAI62_34370 [Jannaschia pagri]|uniref:Pyridoxamine 5'-phosphate oxidase Alr4036 family FMN-binding domain-containing protein n=1 Tax=Jannaschia pagri TaxID=2829797 RepID=A0ABQ4NQX7_9RHOB|nr:MULTISPECIES: pyridoxamine 5'-phosphate oxidase family protein [unclassified Jannaschia]GIT92979.1 hypothetical protein JANAI61_34370 [Jannaschia sp. AI_61]GIT96814.1 hypothetical protein JANAI62_34370 [Jannaschia sp. AI_62]